MASDEEKTVSEKVGFTVDSALLLELGERLVAKRSVALSELIKNAYDADATEVIVTFDRVNEPNGIITIEDNGSGMSLEVLKGSWMRIASDYKVKNPVSPIHNRPRTGEKGVGRFAVRRLAEELWVHSVAKVSETIWQETDVHFDWNQFKPGQDLAEVSCELSVRNYDKLLPTGVRLTLSRVRDAWTVDDFNNVRNELLDLQPPYPLALRQTEGIPASDPGFRVLLIAPDFPRFEGEVTEQFLSAAWGQLTADVAPDGRPSYSLRVRTQSEPISFSPPETVFPDLAGARLYVYYHLYKGTDDTGIDTRSAQRVGRRFGGVAIYQDGFRVFPYGEPSFDWLSLDRDRARRITFVPPLLKNLLPNGNGGRPMLNIPGNNQLFGGVHISKHKHPGIIPTLNREGLLENASLEQLRQFVRLGIDWMTVERHRLESRVKSGQEPANYMDRESPVAFVNRAVTEVRKALEECPSPRATETINQVLNEVQSFVESSTEEQMSKINMLRVLASVGTMVVVFVHQIRGIIDGFRESARSMERLKSGSTPTEIGSVQSRLESWVQVMEAQGSLIGVLLGPDARQRRRQWVLRPFVDRLLSAFDHYCRTNGIELSNSVPSHARTPPMFEGEVYSILINLLTNALKAVRGQPIRAIEVGAEQQSNSFRLWIRDTGVGLAVSERNRVFEPFYTTSRPDPVLGIGTGLGLTIVKDIIDENGGTVQFIDTDSRWRTCIEIRLPKGMEACQGDK